MFNRRWCGFTASRAIHADGQVGKMLHGGQMRIAGSGRRKDLLKTDTPPASFDSLNNSTAPALSTAFSPARRLPAPPGHARCQGACVFLAQGIPSAVETGQNWH